MSEFACRFCSLQTLCQPLELSDVERAALEPLLDSKHTLKKGEQLFQAGDTFKGLYAIRSGAFKYVNQEQIIGFYLPGDFFGLDAVHHQHYPATAIALEESAICFIAYDHLLSVIEQVPELSRRLLEVSSEQLAKQQNSLHHLPADERFWQFILQLSQHFASRGYSAQKFHFPMPRKDIANFLDLAPETISRLLADFQKRGLLKVENKDITLLHQGAQIAGA